MCFRVYGCVSELTQLIPGSTKAHYKRLRIQNFTVSLPPRGVRNIFQGSPQHSLDPPHRASHRIRVSLLSLRFPTIAVWTYCEFLQASAVSYRGRPKYSVSKIRSRNPLHPLTGLVLFMGGAGVLLIGRDASPNSASRQALLAPSWACSTVVVQTLTEFQLL
jgi:hypothetical protein